MCFPSGSKFHTRRGEVFSLRLAPLEGRYSLTSFGSWNTPLPIYVSGATTEFQEEKMTAADTYVTRFVGVEVSHTLLF